MFISEIFINSMLVKNIYSIHNHGLLYTTTNNSTSMISSISPSSRIIIMYHCSQKKTYPLRSFRRIPPGAGGLAWSYILELPPKLHTLTVGASRPYYNSLNTVKCCFFSCFSGCQRMQGSGTAASRDGR